MFGSKSYHEKKNENAKVKSDMYGKSYLWSYFNSALHLNIAYGLGTYRNTIANKYLIKLVDLSSKIYSSSYHNTTLRINNLWS